MNTLLTALCIATSTIVTGNPIVKSPDGCLAVDFDISDGQAVYSVTYDGTPFIERSALGAYTNVGDFTTGLTLNGSKNR